MTRWTTMYNGKSNTHPKGPLCVWLLVSEREVGSECERVEDPRGEAEEVDQRVEIPEAHDEHR